MKGESIKCFIEEGCSLHLNMYSSDINNYSPPYSSSNAVGIVMAVGNLG